MKRFCLITNRKKDENLRVTKKICRMLESFGCTCYLAEEKEGQNGFSYTEAQKIPRDTEGVIVLGGDGTLLQAAQDLLSLDLPLLGINMGTLGFLAETELAELEPALKKLVNDEYLTENHMMLSTVGPGGVTGPSALNDVVVTRSGFSRIIHIQVWINDELMSDYRGDGIIISTPTGSTGYNLSAGGPILTPASQMMVVTPICPHSLNARSMVVSAEDTVRVQIMPSKKTQAEEAIATIDGNYSIDLSTGDCLTVKKAEKTTKLVRFSSGSFFRILRAKMNT